MSLKRRPSAAAGLTNAIGGMLVGLDEQLLRGQPRAEVLVKRGTQLRSERDGATLIVELPDDLPLDSEAPHRTTP